MVRVCFQFKDENEDIGTGVWERYRWVLNYTWPKTEVNFTMQSTNEAPRALEIENWCKAPAQWKKLVPYNNDTIKEFLIPAPAPERMLYEYDEVELPRFLQSND